MAPHRLSACSYAWLLLAAVLSPAAVCAQIEVVPETVLPSELPYGWGTPTVVYEVVGGRKGDALVVWSENDYGGPSTSWSRTIVSRTFDPMAATFAPIVRELSEGTEPEVTAAPSRSGFVVGWALGKDRRNRDLFGRVLDAGGNPLSTPSTLANDFGDDVGIRTIAADGDAIGTTIAWATYGVGVAARRVGPDGTGGLQVAVDPLATASRVAVASTVDGGFVVGWAGPVFARGYTAIGVPKSEPFGFTADSHDILSALVASPVEDVVVAVVVKYDPSINGPYPVLLQRFTSSGTLLGGAIPVTELPDYGTVDAAFDPNGNLYVAWGTFTLPLHMQAYHRDGAPVGPPVATDIVTGPILRVARLADGGFVNVWRRSHDFRYDVVSLCVPGTAVCGDGVLDAFCERCDDGAANSDTLPNTCRSNCRPARCGDGTVDDGESCDDGNLDDCDGCSAECVVEVGLGCGDGVPFPACGEACDDGNAVVGDGCASCVLERGLGGGAPATECFTTWSTDNPANEPRYAKSGAISDKQACTDNDPRCDFDGGVVGSCTFHVRVCANNTHLPACVPATRLASWELRTPSVKAAANRPPFAAVRDALLSVVPGAVVGAAQPDVCSPFTAIPVPRGSGNGRITLKTRATLYDKRSDTDKLRLECRP